MLGIFKALLIDKKGILNVTNVIDVNNWINKVRSLWFPYLCIRLHGYLILSLLAIFVVLLSLLLHSSSFQNLLCNEKFQKLINIFRQIIIGN